MPAAPAEEVKLVREEKFSVVVVVVVSSSLVNLLPQ